MWDAGVPTTHPGGDHAGRARRRQGAAGLGRPLPGRFFSALAGFVEPGESLEECVAREVREEVGIEVSDITYFGSQPWPFPHSVMIGFTARYAGGEITIQEEEIVEAGWYGPDELPPAPRGGMSIAGWLIDDWVQRVTAA
ncbi:MAG: NAD(+) diphosphatase [Acidimicrobiales bacterium]